MPYEIMDQIGVSSNYGPSFFSEEVHFPAERQVGFWKPELMQSHPKGMNGVSPIASSKYDALLPVDKFRPVGANSVDQYEVPQSYIAKDPKAKINVERHLADHERTSSLPMISWKVTDNDLGSRSSYVRPPSVFPQVNKVDVPGVHYENSLFSSSLSEMFAKKLRLPLKDVHSSQSVDKVTSHFEEDEPFESAEEIEAHTIGTLLPDDDDLLSGVLDELEYIAQPNFRDDIEDFDLFSSGEGMELEADDDLSGYLVNKSSDCSGGISNGHQGGTPFAGEHPFGEHPSRTLFVRNINSNVEDSELKVLFEQYGDIRTLYTACKHRGFVMISYYDIRSARNAMKALQHTPLRRRKLDIHFSIPKDNPSEKDINQGTLVVFNLDSSVSNDDLRQIFGVYGEIKEIRETPHKRQHKFIEFYDVRAAEEALRALNQTDIAGKRIKVEPSRPGGARRCLMQQLSLELEHEEAGGCLQQGSPPSDSLSGSYGSAPHGANQGLYSASGAPMNPFTENEFHGISSSVPHSLSSPVRVAPVGSNGNQSGFDEHTHSLGQMKFYFQSMPSFHPHSLPEYHGSVTNSGIPYKSPGTTLGMATNMNFQTNEGVDSLHMHIAGPGGINMHSFELNKGVFGSSGNGSCPLHGQHSVWGNSNSYQPPPPGPLMLPNSPSFTNAVHAHPQHQLHGLPRAPSHMMNTFAPLPGHHHVGSAPAFNPSLWDQRHMYVGDSTEPSGFHPGSLGSLGFSGSSNLHPLELATHNMLPHVAGNCMNPSISSANVGMPSPQQRTHMFPGRSLMIPPMATSFDGPNEHRTRSRRGEANFGQADNKKQYELNIDRIMHREDTRTTLMIKNIPNKYTSKMLLATIDEHHRGTYDFIYLPIDFKNKCNVGYAFINMIDPVQIVPFYQAFNGKKWEKFNSEKVASLAYARIQGKTALIAHFQNSSLMNEDKRCRPILFHTEGPNAGDQEPFPMGINIRSRPGKTRTNNEETHLGSPLAFGNVEEFFNGAESLTGSSKDLE